MIAFGVSPALIMYLWSLAEFAALWLDLRAGLALSAALRLARFNAAIDVEDQPHKSAGFLTGVPAPAGAGLAFLPLYLWIVTGENDWFRSRCCRAVGCCLLRILMISNVATYSWGSIRLRRNVRLEAIGLFALVGAALFAVPWMDADVICASSMSR